MDAQDGWQYARSFDDPDDKWTSEMPPQLQRVISSTGIVSAGLGGSSVRHSSLSSTAPGRVQPSWVRRRRWVRIMRRRLDIPPMAFLEPDGAMYHLGEDGTLIPYVEHVTDDEGVDGQELGAMPPTFLSSAQDYVARARYLVGNQPQDSDANDASLSAVEVRRAIAKVERAVMELRQGILCRLLPLVLFFAQHVLTLPFHLQLTRTQTARFRLRSFSMPTAVIWNGVAWLLVLVAF